MSVWQSCLKAIATTASTCSSRAFGFRLIYADLARSGVGLPVVRAIVPGMEILADFDRHARVHPRLYANYLKLDGKKDPLP